MFCLLQLQLGLAQSPSLFAGPVEPKRTISAPGVAGLASARPPPGLQPSLLDTFGARSLHGHGHSSSGLGISALTLGHEDFLVLSAAGSAAASHGSGAVSPSSRGSHGSGAISPSSASPTHAVNGAAAHANGLPGVFGGSLFGSSISIFGPPPALPALPAYGHTALQTTPTQPSHVNINWLIVD